MDTRQAMEIAIQLVLENIKDYKHTSNNTDLTLDEIVDLSKLLADDDIFFDRLMDFVDEFIDDYGEEWNYGKQDD